MKRLLVTYTIGVASVFFAATPARAENIDLQTIASSASIVGSTGGTALFFQGPVGSGTGVFPSFVQVQKNGTESGYNTTVNNINDTSSDDTHNHAITIADLANAITILNNVSYYTFYLDINEANNSTDTYLSLDDLQVLTSTTANLSNEPGAPSPATPRWTLPAGTEILLLYDLEAGSGFADMTFLVPVSAFSGALSSDFVYLYSAFGALGLNCTGTGCVAGADYGSSAGFEEWAKKTTGAVTVPDGGTTVSLLGFGLLALGYARRRFAKN